MQTLRIVLRLNVPSRSSQSFTLSALREKKTFLFKSNENKRETLSHPLNNNDLHNNPYKWLCSVPMKAESKKWRP